MIRASSVALVLTLTAVPALSAQQAIDRLGWMAGCWEQKSATRSTVEMWMGPAGKQYCVARKANLSAQVR